VNGVFRGGAFYWQRGSERVRVVYRLGAYRQTLSAFDLGFLWGVNGVSKGSGWYYGALYHRDGVRYLISENSVRYGSERIGFRSEWCRKGQ